ncbi:MAG TPA: neutral/alkaline non-lysosomal ceramidase N-terminal domain-containing protein [Cyclobacteriaceae bacterium]|nr:neutral/alkaline non-lysosomal ceramidase N-terminal domain-containing protein [Cyclobacteriaceae bacterium]
MGKKLLKILAWSVGFLMLLALCTLTTVDWTDYKTKAYYQETMAALEQLPWQGGSMDGLTAGWSTVNATPDEPKDLVGYKPRGTYEFVQDSSMIKTLLLDNGQHSVVFLNYELLIIHPDLAKNLTTKIKAEFPIDMVYLTATHTHSGMGGYMPGLMGKIAFGGYDEEVMKMLEEKTLAGIRAASASMDSVSLLYQKTDAAPFVGNRFIPDDPVDPYIRQLIFTKASGETGTLITYSAHATCLGSKFMGLSGDYPFYLTKFLEEDNVDFAMFAAGTMGSHRPNVNERDIASVKQYAEALDAVLTDTPTVSKPVAANSLRFAKLPLGLREPHYRISDNIRLRPWVFNTLFGDTNAHFGLVQIGNTLLVSSSGEISGVFFEDWEKAAAKYGLNLMITIFNGGYIGYITPDQYYNRRYHEVRDMNWFGPYNGAYFDELMTEIIEEAGG